MMAHKTMLLLGFLFLAGLVLTAGAGAADRAVLGELFTSCW
jgi:hypothetical protein